MSPEDEAPRHHPTDATVFAYASGSLREAHRLVVAAHTIHCTSCEGKVRAIEWSGGLMLDELPPSAVRADALPLFFAKLDALHTSGSSHDLAKDDDGLPPKVGGYVLPPVLRDVRPGKLRWIAPGVRRATLFSDSEGRLLFIRVAAKVALPKHTHTGLELTCVLAGAFRDESVRYSMGDVNEASIRDGLNRAHVLTAESGKDCICIVAISGRLHFKSWVVRMLQPIIPF